MPVTIARKIASIRVNLKTTRKRGINSAQSSIVRQPVAKSFVSSITGVLSLFQFPRESIGDYTRCGLLQEGAAVFTMSNRWERPMRVSGQW
jgi:hypothetical protein